MEPFTPNVEELGTQSLHLQRKVKGNVFTFCLSSYNQNKMSLAQIEVETETTAILPWEQLQCFSFRSFRLCETAWHPEKVGKPTSAFAFVPLDPLQGAVFNWISTCATPATLFPLSALYARVYTSIMKLLLQVLRTSNRLVYRALYDERG